MSLARTPGGSLLRSALDEAAKEAMKSGKEVTAFVAYDKETGAEIGAAIHMQTAAGKRWVIEGKLSRKVTASTKPYAVRLELRGEL